MLQHDPAVAVHDRLGQAGRPRGVQHPQRVVERHLGEVQRLAGGQRGQLGPGQPRGRPRDGRAGRAGAEVVHGDQRPPGRAARRRSRPPPRAGRSSSRRRRSRRRRCSTLGAVWANRSITLAAPKSGEQDVQMAPRLAAASRRDQRLGGVGQVGRDAVAPAHAQCPQAGPGAGHLPGQLGVAEPSGPARLGRVADGRRAGVGPRAAQRVPGVVEGGAGEPGHVGHAGRRAAAGRRRAGPARRSSPRSRPRTGRDRRPTTATAGHSRRTRRPRRVARRRPRRPATGRNRSSARRRWCLCWVPRASRRSHARPARSSRSAHLRPPGRR